MISKDKNSDGFTIYELVILILVIIVLAALVFKTYNSIQARARNTTRQSNLLALQRNIETFYSRYGYFPNLSDMNDAGWRTKYMPNLDNSILVDPLSKCNPSKTACLGGNNKPVPKQYEYYPTQSDGLSCDGKVGSKADQTCAQYNLYASYEGNFNGAKYDELQNLD